MHNRTGVRRLTVSPASPPARTAHSFTAVLASLISLFAAGCGGGGDSTGGSSSTAPAISIDTTPRFAYVINTSVIGGYVVDPESGTLIPKGHSQRFFETAPVDLAASPNGRFLYFSDTGGVAAIKRYDIDQQTGVHAYASGAEFAVGSPGAEQIAIHPSGGFLFYRKNGSNPVTTLALDAATGNMSLVGNTTALSTSGMHLAPDGQFLYTSMDIGTKQIQTFHVAANGTLTIVDADAATAGNQPQVFTNVAGPTFNPANREIYLVNLAVPLSVDRYAPDASGLLVLRDSAPVPNATNAAGTLNGLHIDPRGRFGYIQVAGNLIAGFVIDPGTGAVSPIDHDPATAGIQHFDFGPLANTIARISFEPSGHFAYAGFKGGTGFLTKLAIDQTTGTLSQSAAKPELNQILALNGRVDGIVFTTRANVALPQPTYAYSRGANQIGIHRVDPATGLMTDLGAFAVPAYQLLYADPAQRYLYLGESAAYSRLAIDQQTGALSNREPRSNAVPDGPQGLRFDPHNRFAVQTNVSGDGMDLMEVVTGPSSGLGPRKTAVQFTKDPYTLSATTGSSAVRPNSRQLYSTNLVSGTATAAVFVLRMFNLVALPVTFDRVDADPATAGHQDFPMSGGAQETVVEPLGRYLLNLEIRTFLPGGNTNTDNLAVYELDWVTGRPTRRNMLTFPVVFPNHTTGSNPLQIALDPRGRFVYVPTNDGIAAFSFTRNPSGPALTAIDADPGTGPIDLFQTIGANNAVTIDPTGQWLYTPGGGGTEGFGIDQATGALTSVGIVSANSIAQVIGTL